MLSGLNLLQPFWDQRRRPNVAHDCIESSESESFSSSSFSVPYCWGETKQISNVKAWYCCSYLLDIQNTAVGWHKEMQLWLFLGMLCRWRFRTTGTNLRSLRWPCGIGVFGRRSERPSAWPRKSSFIFLPAFSLRIIPIKKKMFNVYFYLINRQNCTFFLRRDGFILFEVRIKVRNCKIPDILL